MAMVRIERRNFRFAPSGTGSTKFVKIGNGEGDRVIGCTCRVIRASDGTGTVSFGNTGANNFYMTTGDVGAGVTGLKSTSSATNLAGNGTVHTSETELNGTYTQGTDTVTPIIDVTFLVIKDTTWNKIITR